MIPSAHRRSGGRQRVITGRDRSLFASSCSTRKEVALHLVMFRIHAKRNSPKFCHFFTTHRDLPRHLRSRTKPIERTSWAQPSCCYYRSTDRGRRSTGCCTSCSPWVASFVPSPETRPVVHLERGPTPGSRSPGRVVVGSTAGISRIPSNADGFSRSFRIAPPSAPTSFA